jgi:hypothetical protein
MELDERPAPAHRTFADQALQPVGYGLCVMASTMARKFSMGVSSWTLWVGPRFIAFSSRAANSGV